MRILHLKGKVFSGKSEGAKFVALPWVEKQIVEKLGFVPYPGTLNIRLTNESGRLMETFQTVKPIEISPAQGFYSGKCFNALLMDTVECVIVIPEIAGYPKDVLEVVASIRLRDKLHLKDGDMVEVTITF